MPKKPKPDASPEATLFRNAPTSAKTLLKLSHSGARLKARKDWMESKDKERLDVLWTNGV